jgi:hypothetical protein
LNNFSIDQILEIYRKKGYRIPTNDSKPYNLILTGVRSKRPVANTFCDRFFCSWMYRGGKAFSQYQITTDPGTYYLKNPCNVNGTALLKPGQYPGVWQVGLHKGYEALVQVGDFTVIRDFNRDDKFDFNSGREETGNSFGIDCHHAGEDSLTVDKWSAGCQVFARLADFNRFMEICRKARDIWENSFTYTLLEESDFDA